MTNQVKIFDTRKIGGVEYPIYDFQAKLNEIAMDKANAIAVDRENGIYKLNGYDVDVTTLTAIENKVASQKFNKMKVADFIPVNYGSVAAWASEIVGFMDFTNADDFESGFVDIGEMGATAAKDNNSMDEWRLKTQIWRKQISYTISDLEQAMRTGVWNKVERLSNGRFRGYERGFCKFAIMGDSMGRHFGLMNQPDVLVDTSLIPKPMKDMTDAEFSTLLASLSPFYKEHSEFTEDADTFAIPSLEFSALAGQRTAVGLGFASGISRLKALEETFREASGNSDARVVGCDFVNAVKNNNVNKYALYRYDPESLILEHPVPYGVFMGASVDGWNYQNTAVAQFTGVKQIRPNEMIYFTHTVSE